MCNKYRVNTWKLKQTLLIKKILIVILYAIFFITQKCQNIFLEYPRRFLINISFKCFISFFFFKTIRQRIYQEFWRKVIISIMRLNLGFGCFGVGRLGWVEVGVGEFWIEVVVGKFGVVLGLELELRLGLGWGWGPWGWGWGWSWSWSWSWGWDWVGVGVEVGVGVK